MVAQANDFATDYDDLVVRHLHTRLGLAPTQGGHFFRTLGLMPPPIGALPDSSFVGNRHYSLPDYPAACWRSSAESYARFLSMAVEGGVWAGERLMSEDSAAYMLEKSGFGNSGEAVSNGLWLYLLRVVLV